ncbi:MAG: type I-U CRISPR-associated protein Cas5/Cas6 [Myxococcaceae bacterium]|nr:type I-U CRISPR-associated protein Cas5/Cas6 [Myxococcaceae bacterium]
MSSKFRVSIRFLQPYSHGRGEDGTPEWPPSPLRLFQALAACSLGREPNEERRRGAARTLEWLERLEAPEIVAARAAPVSNPYRSYVPDNVGDKVARAWSAGREAKLEEYRSEKDVDAVKLEDDAVHYLFETAEDVAAQLPTLQRMARSLTHVGWGIDHVAGDADADISGLAGERWLPVRHGGRLLRIPIPGTLAALEERHRLFLTRLEGDTFRPVTPLSAFATVSYARATDPMPRPYIAFRVVQPTTGDRLSLDPVTRTRDVAAWLRHAVAEVAEGWPFGPTKTLIHGHPEEGVRMGPSTPRLSFLPLPTISPRKGRNGVHEHVEGIARVAVVGQAGLEAALEWLKAHLSGRELEWRGRVVAALEPLPDQDWVLKRYTAASTRWSTVTPVVLPGYDDGSRKKAEKLLRNAFAHAGFEREVLESIQTLEWRRVGFRVGTELAARYLPPDKVVGPHYHVRVRFAREVAGPLAIGSGRFRGMGVFAAE